MYLCRICDEQVMGDDKALSMHMRTHDNSPNIDASSLVLLSNGSLKPFTLLIKKAKQQAVILEKPLFPNKGGNKDSDGDEDNDDEVVRGTFECRACNKVFYSHQALGGHRASHKKIKGCFAAAFLNPNPNPTPTPTPTPNDALVKRNPDPNDENNNMGIKKKPKSHECSICHRVFPSGQALGGHKRCHWLPSSVSDTPYIYSTSSSVGVSTTFHNFLDIEGQPLYKKTKYNSKPLDLNQLPLPFSEVLKDNDKNIKGDVGSHIYGMRPSVTTNWVGDRGIRRDINSIYQSLCQFNSTHDHYFPYKPINSDIDAKSIRLKSIHLKNFKDNNVDGLHSSWLQLGIGSTSTV